MNKKIIKKHIKNILQVDRIRAVKEYSNKLNLSFINSLFKLKSTKFDYKRILEKANNQNFSTTAFYYGLDDKLIVYSSKNIIGNIPINYEYILSKGIDGITDTNLRECISKYIDRASDSRIIKGPVKNLKEALQMILFWNQILWQSGHRLNGLGRLDKVLDKYEITDNSKDLILDFLRTIHYCYDFKSNVIKGDIGQIIIIGGLEEDGSYFRNKYTDLFIECLSELRLPDPKILLRASKNIPIDLMELAVKSISTGIGSPLISNDEVIIPLLEDFGYEKADSFNYGVSACWEPLSIGNSLEQNNLSDIEFGGCINETLIDNNLLKCKKFDDVYELFLEKLKNKILLIIEQLNNYVWEEDELVSSLMNLTNIDISKGGTKYNNYGILSTGMSSAVNSLLNIKRFVFEEKKYTLSEIQSIIINNYPNEHDVQVFNKNIEGYGIDNSNTILLTNKIIKYSEDILSKYKNYLGGKVKFGLSSPNYLGIGSKIGATLDGRKSNMPFPTHISRDKGDSLTEIVGFASKLSLSGISSNANVVDILIQKNMIENNIDKFIQYILGGIYSGIFQMQINVLSYAQLVDAKKHPEKYNNLIVRVWGFSAYFNDLPEEYKDNLIRRAKEMETGY